MNRLLCFLLGCHAWRLRGLSVRCARCGRRTNLYPLLMKEPKR